MRIESGSRAKWAQTVVSESGRGFRMRYGSVNAHRPLCVGIEWLALNVCTAGGRRA